MKHSEHTLKTYAHSHCNMFNILIYICNIKMKHLQHPDETSETLETYACNMGFQRNVILLLGRMDARRCKARHRRRVWRRRMELAGAAAAQPSCDSPMPARSLGSRPSARPYCYYSSVAARSSAVVQCRLLVGDGVRCSRRWGEASWGEDTSRRRDGGPGTTGQTVERPGNAQPRHDGRMSGVGIFLGGRSAALGATSGQDRRPWLSVSDWKKRKVY